MLTYATVENAKGWVFHKTHLYDDDISAIKAALRGAAKLLQKL